MSNTGLAHVQRMSKTHLLYAILHINKKLHEGLGPQVQIWIALMDILEDLFFGRVQNRGY